MDYYIGTQSEKRGPYAKSQLKTMWDSGAITSDTLFSMDGMNEWQPVADLFSSGDASKRRGEDCVAPRPRLKLLYSTSIVLGIVIAAYIYLINFDAFSETEIVGLTPIWFFPIVFGYYGFVAHRMALRREKTHLETVADVLFAVIKETMGPFGRICAFVVHAPFLIVRSKNPLLTAFIGSLIWAVGLYIFFEVVFPDL